jgi:hypothetical protein
MLYNKAIPIFSIRLYAGAQGKRNGDVARKSFVIGGCRVRR